MNHTITDPEWFFFSGGPGAPRYGDDPTKHAVNHDTETFVREVLQNANDQALSADEPVGVTFNFLTLSGQELRDFLKSLHWTDLKERLKSVTRDGRSRGYRDLLDRLEGDEAELRLLRITDRNTTGLTGRWEDDSNYAALVRDELYSSKQNDRAGGSYGLGKSVLWTFSGASTVVFNSQLADAHERGNQRVIARTKLPTHRLERDGRSYQGAGWLCQPIESEDGTRPESLWNEAASATAERLRVERPSVPGTSILVVNYRDPTRDERPSLNELADDFIEAAVKYFWPAMYRDDLEVEVRVDGETKRANIWDVPSIRPFVECFESRYNYDQTLNVPGDVAGLDIPVSLPPRASGEETADADVRLAARLASPADDDTLLNHVALFRGAGMIVKYYNQSRIAFGDRNFHAILACGEANDFRDVTDGDREVERFLRYAEPPEHDEWKSTENLREQYQRGFRKALDEMFNTTRDGLRHLVAQSDGRSEILAERVRKRFPIHGGKARTGSAPSPSVVFDIETVSGFDDGRWTFSGRIAPTENEFKGWTAELSLTGVGEDGSRYDDVPIVTVESENPAVTTDCVDGIAKLTGGANATQVEFEGYSERIGKGDVRSGRIGETQLEVRAELRIGGDEA